jgi:hypothetical protein
VARGDARQHHRIEGTMSEQTRSQQACPVCGQHTLAIDEPPQIDVMGVQSYSDLLGMGDLRSVGSVGIVCLSCGTHWRDKAAFDRGEPDPDVGPLPDAGPDHDDEVDGEDDDSE